MSYGDAAGTPAERYGGCSASRRLGGAGVDGFGGQGAGEVVPVLARREGEIFALHLVGQRLDHHAVLEPELDDVEEAAAAAGPAEPALAPGDRVHACLVAAHGDGDVRLARAAVVEVAVRDLGGAGHQHLAGGIDLE